MTDVDGKHPLVVDLDGTLTPTDTLVESVVSLVKRNPWAVFLLLGWLLAGRSRLKERIAESSGFSARHLPWRVEVLQWLDIERQSGRRIILATAAHHSIAAQAAEQVGPFDLVLATTDNLNLKGHAKLAAIRQQVGEDFVYAGDSRADLPIWAAARGAVLVAVSPSVGAQVRGQVPIEREFAPLSAGWRVWLRAIRAHQWIKNLLIFVPLLTSFSFADGSRVVAAALTFVAFSLAASGTYLLNDLWDLDSDRQHPRKRQRPMASGAVPLLHGMAAAAALLLAGLAVALFAAPAVAAIVAGYIVLTTSYSWVLKRYVLLDVLMLALLYTYRVLAGAVAISVQVTPWLLAFSVFTFLSLALVKRCAELVTLAQGGRAEATGRDYRVSDLVVLWPLGVGASLCSIVVFGLYIGSPEARAVYGNADVMWLVAIGLVYWTGRLWIKTSRGEMHDDPIVFALRDFGSRVTIVAMTAVPLLAHYLR